MRGGREVESRVPRALLSYREDCIRVMCRMHAATTYIAWPSRKGVIALGMELLSRERCAVSLTRVARSL